MGLEIKEQKEAPLLSRKEIKAVLTFSHKATPTNEAVQKQVADAVKADAKTVVVKQIMTRFGEQTADVSAYVYDSEAARDSIEPKTKIKKKKAGEAEEKPAEKPAEEKPAEKKKPAEKEKPAEKPAEEKAAPAEAPAKKEKPAEEKPAQEKPAKEKPEEK